MITIRDMLAEVMLQRPDLDNEMGMWALRNAATALCRKTQILKGVTPTTTFLRNYLMATVDPVSGWQGGTIAETGANWNAATNTPPLPEATDANYGLYYRVTATGMYDGTVYTLGGYAVNAGLGWAYWAANALGTPFSQPSLYGLPEASSNETTKRIVRIERVRAARLDVENPYFVCNWNADSNVPALPTPDSTNLGFYYIVSVEGTYENVAYFPGDIVVNNGAWTRIPVEKFVEIPECNKPTVESRNRTSQDGSGDITSWAQVEGSAVPMSEVARTFPGSTPSQWLASVDFTWTPAYITTLDDVEFSDDTFIPMENGVSYTRRWWDFGNGSSLIDNTMCVGAMTPYDSTMDYDMAGTYSVTLGYAYYNKTATKTKNLAVVSSFTGWLADKPIVKVILDPDPTVFPDLDMSDPDLIFEVPDAPGLATVGWYFLAKNAQVWDLNWGNTGKTLRAWDHASVEITPSPVGDGWAKAWSQGEIACVTFTEVAL